MEQATICRPEQLGDPDATESVSSWPDFRGPDVSSCADTLLEPGRPVGPTGEADAPSRPMNAENEREFALLLSRLAGFAPSDLPDRFAALAHSMIIPALNGVAQQLKAAGYQCRIDAEVDEPIPANGQAVYFTFDTRYRSGDNSLCIRLAPGESVVRVEMPGAGSVMTQQIPLPEFAGDNVQRVAINYIQRVLQ